MPTIEVPNLQGILWDTAGTLVDDRVKVPGYQTKKPLIIAGYESVLRQAGITLSEEELELTRGKGKLPVVQEKIYLYRTDLNNNDPDYEQHLALIQDRSKDKKFDPNWLSSAQQELAQQLYIEQLIPALLYYVPQLVEVPKTSEVLAFCKDNGIFTGVGSGFPREVANAIYQHMGWVSKGLMDYTTCAEEAGADRPEPNMINSFLKAAKHLPADWDVSMIATPSNFTSDVGKRFGYRIAAKVGDTIEDAKEGAKVGANVILIDFGSQSLDKLLAAPHDAILRHLGELPDYLQNHGYLG